MFVRLRSKPQRRTVKQSTAQTVPARCHQLGPPGLLSIRGPIGSRRGPAIHMLLAG